MPVRPVARLPLPAPMARKQLTQPRLQAFPAKPPISVPCDDGSARYAEITDKKNRLVESNRSSIALQQNLPGSS
ncbi:hypothetical protein PGTUg99_026625 [Puccinia graminis f. sp. tritici]|uniref:Uncharacterized protein n=1 Tax=Puccinia graminis f. sp. tritici TaxID=56615 RepID=A0A5B0RHQ5_PUCGR|nr:hypothetical protein PGTUg99_026625 [Puccinia graminis f. sp. tritici]